MLGLLTTTGMAEDVVTNDVTMPTLVHAEQIRITSSLASDGTDLTPLYDLSTETTAEFADAADGVSISMTTEEAFQLHSIVVNKTDTKYDAKMYASNDGENWVEVKFDTKTKDDFTVYQAKGLGRKYKFYRLTATTEDAALSFHTVALYEKVEDVWPFALYQMFGK